MTALRLDKIWERNRPDVDNRTARMIHFELADGRPCSPDQLDGLVRHLREDLALDGPHHGRESHV